MFKVKARIGGILERHFTGESMGFREVLAIFLPLWVDQAFVTVLNMLNTAMISSSGADAVSAVSMVDSLNLFLLNIFIAVATGGTVIVAQYKGAGADDMVTKSASQAVIAVSSLAIFLSLVLFVLHSPVLHFLFGNAEPGVLKNASTYLKASFLSYPCFALTQAICSVMRGSGDTRSSLLITIITNLSYVLLNLMLVTGFQMGVGGLSFSLNISRGLGAVCAVIYLFRFNHSLNMTLEHFRRVNWPMLKRIFLVGIPFAAEQLFFNGGKILTQTFIVQLGTLSIQTNAICTSIASLYQFTGNALGLSAITVIGQCMGRRHIKDVRKFSRSFIGAGIISFIISGLIFLPLFPLLIKLYSPAPEIIPNIFFIMVLATAAQIFLWPISFISPYILRAAGDTGFTTLSSLLTMWLFRVILGYVLGVVLPFGITGVWCAMMMEWGIRGTIFLLRMRGDKWYRHHLIDT